MHHFCPTFWPVDKESWVLYRGQSLRRLSRRPKAAHLRLVVSMLAVLALTFVLMREFPRVAPPVVPAPSSSTEASYLNHLRTNYLPLADLTRQKITKLVMNPGYALRNSESGEDQRILQVSALLLACHKELISIKPPTRHVQSHRNLIATYETFFRCLDYLRDDMRGGATGNARGLARESLREGLRESQRWEGIIFGTVAKE